MPASDSSTEEPDDPHRAPHHRVSPAAARRGSAGQPAYLRHLRLRLSAPLPVYEQRARRGARRARAGAPRRATRVAIPRPSPAGAAQHAAHAERPAGRHPLLHAIRRVPRAGGAGSGPLRSGHPRAADRHADRPAPQCRGAAALLDAPEPTTRLGLRDRAMLLLALTGGLRVSELVGLRLDEVQFTGRYVDVRVRGKGRRERALTLWKSVGDTIRAWLAVRGEAPTPELFLNAWGKPLTRSGFECVLAKHVAATAARCPSLRAKRVSPHVLRHSCALTTLQATRDLRNVSLWLGHARTQTTDIYLQADP